ncbi:hypothetical protein D6783_04530 [Candidatus Woesearchaeota archaeon]|nr:MAG: hypothetical protein D6783_04530 [Candidatus Woesearchaeota archaeon]
MIPFGQCLNSAHAPNANMKLLAFTDLHEDPADLRQVKKKAAHADLIVCAGDFTIFGRDTEGVLSALNHLGKTVLLIHGNHEFEEQVEALTENLENIVYLHERYWKTGPYTFVGYGGGGFSKTDPRLEDIKEDLAAFLKKNGILVVHQPPFGTRIDKLPWFDDHVGSKSIRSLIEQAKPLLCLCGHLHETFHEHDRIGKTHIINPGPDGELIDLNTLHTPAKRRKKQ